MYTLRDDSVTCRSQIDYIGSHVGYVWITRRLHVTCELVSFLLVSCIQSAPRGKFLVGRLHPKCIRYVSFLLCCVGFLVASCRADRSTYLRCRRSGGINGNVLHSPARNFLVEHKRGVALHGCFCGICFAVCRVVRTAFFRMVLHSQYIFAIRTEG